MRKHGKKAVLWLCLFPLLLVTLSYGGYLFWYSHRAQPEPEARETFSRHSLHSRGSKNARFAHDPPCQN